MKHCCSRLIFPSILAIASDTLWFGKIVLMVNVAEEKLTI